MSQDRAFSLQLVKLFWWSENFGRVGVVGLKRFSMKKISGRLQFEPETTAVVVLTGWSYGGFPLNRLKNGVNENWKSMSVLFSQRIVKE